MFLILISIFLNFSLSATNTTHTTTITQNSNEPVVLRLQLRTNNIIDIQEQMLKALEDNNVEEFKKLCLLLNKNVQDNNWYLLALKYKNFQVINFLLSYKVKLDNNTLKALFLEAKNNNELLKNLIKYTHDNQTILHQAANELNIELIDQIIELCPELINKQDNRGNTALHIILSKKNINKVEIINKFKNAKARTDIKNTNNRTAEELVIGFVKHKTNNNCLSLEVTKTIDKKKSTKKKTNRSINLPQNIQNDLPEEELNSLVYVPHTDDNKNVNAEMPIFVTNFEDIEDPFEGFSSYEIGL